MIGCDTIDDNEDGVGVGGGGVGGNGIGGDVNMCKYKECGYSSAKKHNKIVVSTVISTVFFIQL